MRLGGVIANRSADTDQIDRFNDAIGLKRLAHFPDLDVIRRSRLKKCDAVRDGDLARSSKRCRTNTCVWPRRCGPAPSRSTREPMKDRDIFDLLGFD